MNKNSITKYSTLLLVYFVLFVPFVVTPQSIWNKILTPVYVSPYVYIGYDSNSLKFSDSEMDEITVGSAELAGVNTFDSGVVKPSVRLEYSPGIITGHETNLIVNISKAEYIHSEMKSYLSFSTRAEFHAGLFKWIKAGVSLQPGLYLRNYNDKDGIGNDLTSCNFAQESVYLYASHPFLNWVWGGVTIKQIKQYYEKPFTEFDTEIISGKIKLSTKKINKMNFSGWFETGEGDNATFGSGYISTQFDRSYQFNRFGGKWELELGGLIKSLKISIDVNDRMYKTEEENDPLHSGRSHRDIKYSMWILRDINESIEAEYYFRYRVRDIFSDYEWVEQLKSFHKFETGISISFNTYLDLFY